MTATVKVDRRVERTRQSIMQAFRDALFERGYDALTVRDIIDRANVGRSTFYEHFEGKDDLFRKSLSPVFKPLAQSVDREPDLANLRLVLQHFWNQRRFARALFTGSTRAIMSAYLAELFEERLAARSRRRDAASLIPLPLVGAHLAEALLGLVQAWFRGTTSCTTETLADAVHLSMNASASALLGERL